MGHFAITRSSESSAATALDYDDDGKTDVTALRQGTTYMWFVIRSSNQTFNAVGLGRKPDFPTQGDYDRDGKTDFSIWTRTTRLISVVPTRAWHKMYLAKAAIIRSRTTTHTKFKNGLPVCDLGSALYEYPRSQRANTTHKEDKYENSN